MKKSYLLTIFLNIVCMLAFAQNPLPNPGFENWTQNGNYYDPDNWNTLNPSTIVLGILTATRANPPDVHSGSLAIKLQTKVVFGLTANGIASTGTIITTPPYGVVGGIPFSGRPDSIAGWFKYQPAGTDSGFAQFLSLDANNDTVGFVRWSAPNTNVTSYTRFSKAINYFSSNTPDTSQWILSSSRGTNPVVGSLIYFDDLQLITNPVGIEQTIDDKSVQVYTNLDSGTITILNKNGKRLFLTLFEITGRQILKADFKSSRYETHIHYCKNGVYLYRLADERGNLVKTGKLIFH